MALLDIFKISLVFNCLIGFSLQKPYTDHFPKPILDNLEIYQSIPHDICPSQFLGVRNYPYDCFKYLSCRHGTPFVMNCPEGTMFNVSKKFCDYSERVICKISKFPGKAYVIPKYIWEGDVSLQQKVIPEHLPRVLAHKNGVTLDVLIDKINARPHSAKNFDEVAFSSYIPSTSENYEVRNFQKRELNSPPGDFDDIDRLPELSLTSNKYRRDLAYQTQSTSPYGFYQNPRRESHGLYDGNDRFQEQSSGHLEFKPVYQEQQVQQQLTEPFHIPKHRFDQHQSSGKLLLDPGFVQQQSKADQYALDPYTFQNKLEQHRRLTIEPIYEEQQSQQFLNSPQASHNKFPQQQTNDQFILEPIYTNQQVDQSTQQIYKDRINQHPTGDQLIFDSDLNHAQTEQHLIQHAPINKFDQSQSRYHDDQANIHSDRFIYNTGGLKVEQLPNNLPPQSYDKFNTYQSQGDLIVEPIRPHIPDRKYHFDANEGGIIIEPVGSDFSKTSGPKDTDQLFRSKNPRPSVDRPHTHTATTEKPNLVRENLPVDTNSDQTPRIRDEDPVDKSVIMVPAIKVNKASTSDNMIINPGEEHSGNMKIKRSARYTDYPQEQSFGGYGQEKLMNAHLDPPSQANVNSGNYHISGEFERHSSGVKGGSTHFRETLGEIPSQAPANSGSYRISEEYETQQHQSSSVKGGSKHYRFDRTPSQSSINSGSYKISEYDSHQHQSSGVKGGSNPYRENPHRFYPSPQQVSQQPTYNNHDQHVSNSNSFSFHHEPTKDQIVKASFFEGYSVVEYGNHHCVVSCHESISGILPHPFHCGKVFVCNKGSTTVDNCPAGTVFNFRKSYCDTPETTICDFGPRFQKSLSSCVGWSVAVSRNNKQASVNADVSQNKQPYKPSQGTGSYIIKKPKQDINDKISEDLNRHNGIYNIVQRSDGYCDVECYSENTGLLPHPLECSKFVRCVHGKIVTQECGPGTVFNPLYSVCDFPFNVDCGTSSIDIRAHSRCKGFHLVTEIENADIILNSQSPKTPKPMDPKIDIRVPGKKINNNDQEKNWDQIVDNQQVEGIDTSLLQQTINPKPNTNNSPVLENSQILESDQKINQHVEQNQDKFSEVNQNQDMILETVDQIDDLQQKKDAGQVIVQNEDQSSKFDQSITTNSHQTIEHNLEQSEVLTDQQHQDFILENIDQNEQIVEPIQPVIVEKDNGQQLEQEIIISHDVGQVAVDNQEQMLVPDQTPDSSQIKEVEINHDFDQLLQQVADFEQTHQQVVPVSVEDQFVIEHQNDKILQESNPIEQILEQKPQNQYLDQTIDFNQNQETVNNQMVYDQKLENTRDSKQFDSNKNLERLETIPEAEWKSLNGYLIKDDTNTNTCYLKCDVKTTSFLPHPTDCDTFIECRHGVTTVHKCVKSHLFNPETKSCLPAEQVKCVYSIMRQNHACLKFSVVEQEPRQPKLVKDLDKTTKPQIPAVSSGTNPNMFLDCTSISESKEAIVEIHEDAQVFATVPSKLEMCQIKTIINAQESNRNSKSIEELEVPPSVDDFNQKQDSQNLNQEIVDVPDKIFDSKVNGEYQHYNQETDHFDQQTTDQKLFNQEVQQVEKAFKLPGVNSNQEVILEDLDQHKTNSPKTKTINSAPIVKVDQTVESQQTETLDQQFIDLSQPIILDDKDQQKIENPDYPSKLIQNINKESQKPLNHDQELTGIDHQMILEDLHQQKIENFDQNLEVFKEDSQKIKSYDQELTDMDHQMISEDLNQQKIENFDQNSKLISNVNKDSQQIVTSEQELTNMDHQMILENLDQQKTNTYNPYSQTPQEYKPSKNYEQELTDMDHQMIFEDLNSQKNIYSDSQFNKIVNKESQKRKTYDQELTDIDHQMISEDLYQHKNDEQKSDQYHQMVLEHFDENEDDRQKIESVDYQSILKHKPVPAKETPPKANTLSIKNKLDDLRNKYSKELKNRKNKYQKSQEIMDSQLKMDDIFEDDLGQKPIFDSYKKPENIYQEKNSNLEDSFHSQKQDFKTFSDKDHFKVNQFIDSDINSHNNNIDQLNEIDDPGQSKDGYYSHSKFESSEQHSAFKQHDINGGYSKKVSKSSSSSWSSKKTSSSSKSSSSDDLSSVDPEKLFDEYHKKMFGKTSVEEPQRVESRFSASDRLVFRD